MQRATIRRIAALFAALPFGFGLIRLFTAGDARMLWMALAALLGSGAAIVVFELRPLPRKGWGKPRRFLPPPMPTPAGARHFGTRNVITMSVTVLVVATLFAGAAGYLQGATAALGIWPVAFVFGVCCAVSSALDTYQVNSQIRW